MIIWSFSKAKNYYETEGLDQKHSNFNLDKSLKLLTQRVTVKINKIDGKSASIIVNSLKNIQTYEHFVRQMKSRIEQIKNTSSSEKRRIWGGNTINNYSNFLLNLWTMHYRFN